MTINLPDPRHLPICAEFGATKDMIKGKDYAGIAYLHKTSRLDNFGKVSKLPVSSSKLTWANSLKAIGTNSLSNLVLVLFYKILTISTIEVSPSHFSQTDAVV